MASLHRPHRRDVPRDWETQLAEISPRDEQTTWLRLRWEPGYPWERVERFVIDEMIPAHAVDDEILTQLQRDTPPQGFWDRVNEVFIPEDGCLITKTAHALYQQYRCWARPWWVIQGTKGGHKRWFTRNERQLLKLARLPEDPPAPGDLAYAPFDERVVTQIVKYDLLREENGRIRQGLASKKLLTLVGFRRQEEADARDFRKLLLSWLSDQVTEQATDLTKGLMALDAPRRDIDPKRLEAAADRAEASFIETGRRGGGLPH